MKIQSINHLSYNQVVLPKKQKGEQPLGAPKNFAISNLHYVPNFTAFANSNELRKLYKYDIPCMYSGVVMIDPQKIKEIDDKDLLGSSVKQAIETLSPFENKLQPAEKRLFKIIKQQAIRTPNKNLQEIVQQIKPQYLDNLRISQAYIFDELRVKSHHLPEEYRGNFEKLMKKTDNRLNEIPMVVSFSKREFQHQISKLFEHFHNVNFVHNLNALINQFPHHTEPGAMKKQVDILESIENSYNYEVEKGRLKDKEEVRNLFKISKKRIRKEPVVIPFSKKAFVYDLSKALDGLKDENLKRDFLKIAEKLPTSSDSLAAHIIKLSDYNSEKIGLSLLTPSMGTVEHIQPRYRNGRDRQKNYGLACQRYNSQRQHTTLYRYVIESPGLNANIQKYVDRLIELSNNGTFDKVELPSKYIDNLKETLIRESEGILDIDISKLKERK